MCELDIYMRILQTWIQSVAHALFQVLYMHGHAVGSKTKQVQSDYNQPRTCGTLLQHVLQHFCLWLQCPLTFGMQDILDKMVGMPLCSMQRHIKAAKLPQVCARAHPG